MYIPALSTTVPPGGAGGNTTVGSALRSAGLRVGSGAAVLDRVPRPGAISTEPDSSTIASVMAGIS